MDNNKNSIIVCINCSASTSNNDKNNSFDAFNKLLGLNFNSRNADGAGADSIDTSHSRTIDEDYAFHFPWTLDTKYYTVALNLCKFFRPTGTVAMTENFVDRVEAIILQFDPQCVSFSQVQSCFTSFISQCQPSLRVLYVDSPLSRDQDGGDFQPIVEWCVRNEFELVESEPMDDEARLEAEENRELFGVDRIMQILKAHNWPDLVMKDERAERDERAKRLNNYLSTGETADACNFNTSSENSSDFSEVDGTAGGSASTTDDPRAFEQLFAKFSAMKTTADQLTGDERKLFAAKVALDFYKSLGGDDNNESDDDATVT